jgi:hypothetical protein
MQTQRQNRNPNMMRTTRYRGILGESQIGPRHFEPSDDDQLQRRFERASPPHPEQR